TVMLQSARQKESINDGIKVCENNLYDSLRSAVPVIDAALSKIVRLTGGYRLICSDESLQEELDFFVDEVDVGAIGKSLHSFTDSFLDSLLTYGNAVGEIILDTDTRRIVGLFNGNVNDIEIQTCSASNEKKFCIREENGDKTIIQNPELLVFSSINTQAGQTYGISVLRGLPSLSSVLMRIYECIGQNYDRVGNVRYAVTYNPGNDPSEKAFAKDRAMQIAKEWSDGMNAGRNGEIRDFVAVGDVDIKVIGSENQLYDTNIPVRQLLEQIVSKLSIPPFLLGLNWSSTERMSAQQADILTSELEYYRRRITPVIKKIGTAFLRTCGSDADVIVEWDNINLQDEVALADARLKNAKALEIELKLKENYNL
ncbi:MAG: serine/threonine protein phosphatase, partial [Clostridiales bacterium]|nr:serine/threonine protein phosphatase [Clostridiales bacterium]